MFTLTRQNENRRGTPPTEKHLLTESLVASIWKSTNEIGGTRFTWQAVRKGDENGKTFSTFRPEHLTEFPLFIARMSEVLGNSSSVSEDLRNKLVRQASFLYQLSEANKDQAPMVKSQSSNGLTAFAA